VEDRFWHKDLTPNDKTGKAVGKAEGNGSDGFQVLGHIFPHPSVPSGGTPDKNTILILQSDGKAVHLGFHIVGDPLYALLHSLTEFKELLQRKHILETFQRDLVDHLGETLGHLASDPLGGRVGSDKFRVGGLQLLQTAEIVVKVIVGHSGGIQHIIFVIGSLQLLAKLFDLLAYIHLRHFLSGG
jgi:hypothetical protein